MPQTEHPETNKIQQRKHILQPPHSPSIKTESFQPARINLLGTNQEMGRPRLDREVTKIYQKRQWGTSQAQGSFDGTWLWFGWLLQWKWAILEFSCSGTKIVHA